MARADHPLLCMAPPHLALPAAPAALDTAYPTYVHWGSTGRWLLANYHRDHAYTFDCTHPHQPHSAIKPPTPQQPLTAPAQAAKLAGDERFFRDGAFHRAVLQYEIALRGAPGNASLLASAAMAMLKRCATGGWLKRRSMRVTSYTPTKKYPGTGQGIGHLLCERVTRHWQQIPTTQTPTTTSVTHCCS